MNEEMRTFITLALKEDLGRGDVTSESSVPKDLVQKGYILAKEDGVVAGVEVAKEVFKQFDDNVRFTVLKNDGERVVFGDVVIELEGLARSILSSERLALNFMQRMSGIATRTDHIVKSLEGTPTKVLDTRKTTPGLRYFEKWAVKIGGGVNHRMGLFDMILLKDNHVDYAGNMEAAIKTVSEYLEKRDSKEKKLPLVIETRSFQEIEDAIAGSEKSGITIERILLDNFSPDKVSEAVEKYAHLVTLEASGGITPDNVREYGDAGVDFVSMGYLTHSVKSLDLSLKSTPHV
ncbi:MAG: nicotinate-nucleotide diphosphorylase (carboxylating) [Bacteroidetes bacterium]|nr:MAG: nicotinate-nucleotide diphosphorylase (carboxylating) [Bacteroidota bacterium]